MIKICKMNSCKIIERRPSLSAISKDGEHLAGMIGFTSTLAESISGKVRQLDLAKVAPPRRINLYN